jgi:hypothetical protein
MVQIHSPRPFFSMIYQCLLVFCLHRCRRFCRRPDHPDSKSQPAQWRLVAAPPVRGSVVCIIATNKPRKHLETRWLASLSRSSTDGTCCVLMVSPTH